eukprot:m.17886 g.17886  ORF g.17886 m.17886 type:complete len:289 (-) comp4852_c0_seq1:776-1642(-)
MTTKSDKVLGVKRYDTYVDKIDFLTTENVGVYEYDGSDWSDDPTHTGLLYYCRRTKIPKLQLMVVQTYNSKFFSLPMCDQTRYSVSSDGYPRIDFQDPNSKKIYGLFFTKPSEMGEFLKHHESLFGITREDSSSYSEPTTPISIPISQPPQTKLEKQEPLKRVKTEEEIADAKKLPQESKVPHSEETLSNDTLPPQSQHVATQLQSSSASHSIPLITTDSRQREIEVRSELDILPTVIPKLQEAFLRLLNHHTKFTKADLLELVERYVRERCADALFADYEALLAAKK